MIKIQTTKDTFLAVVVTFNPGSDLHRNLTALRPQVDVLLVVDNGSDDPDYVANVAIESGCRLIRNQANLGIAKAFNQGISVAISEAITWVVTFDQDSLAPSGLIVGLLELYYSHPRQGEIGIIAPTHRDRNSGGSYYHRGDRLVVNDHWRIVRSCISSGCMVPTTVYTQVGMLDQSLFIDFVDHDFCMRCRGKGFLVVESIHEVLEHSVGDASTRRVFGRRLVFTNHSPMRYYYITRNQLEVYRRSLRIDFFWVTRGLLLQGIAAVLVLIYEKQRGAKFLSMLHGVRDFVLRRFGPRRSP